MNTTKLTPGDRVEVNVRGLLFPARYQGRDQERHRVNPEQANISYLHVSSRQIVKKLGVAG